MAGTSNHRAFKASSATQDLRAIAQSHLNEIEADLAAEAIQQETTARDLQRYSKVKRSDRPKPSSSTSSSTLANLPSPLDPEDILTSKPKLRSAQDVLDRLRHDSSFNLSEYHVGYLERFEGIKEMPARSWISESTDEEWIPQHRIRYIKHVNSSGAKEIVWDRDTRMDRIFGSGNPMNGAEDGAEDQSEFGGVALSSTS